LNFKFKILQPGDKPQEEFGNSLENMEIGKFPFSSKKICRVVALIFTFAAGIMNPNRNLETF